MKTVKTILIFGVIGTFISCNKCIECTVTYSNETEEHVDEWCDDQTMQELTTYYTGLQSAGTIKADWNCKE